MSANQEQQKQPKRPLICACCSLPFARVQGDRLVIQSRHDNQSHSNALTAEELRRLADEMEKSK